MPGPSAISLALSARQRALLQHLQQRQAAPRRPGRRVAVLLALGAGPRVEAAARRLGLTRLTARHWRGRWLAAAPRLQRPEQEQAPDRPLLALTEHALGGAPRPGGPATFSPERIAAVAAVARGPPGRCGRPISHWPARELADEAKRRQTVSGISARTASRPLKAGRAAAAPQPPLAQRQPG